MNITVYCGANLGKDPEFAERARELGSWMAEKGYRLVYGAGDVGMMGIVSNAVLQGGGEVLGVTPDFFILAEEIHEELTELRITADLTERRAVMIEEGDAFIALPGGTGTLDEISEVMSLTRLGLLGDRKRPVMIYNINGYYDHFFRFMDRMAEEEFFGRRDRENVIEVTCIEDIEKVMMTAGQSDTGRNRLYNR
ncbi:MAG: TIGR00730 family Rossman fold protein [Mogibacterium sp.]|nr:TIGR00730 family Rossman fold protein [Mogibacterium sp.]